MTVQELINELAKLSDEDKQKQVFYAEITYDNFYHSISYILDVDQDQVNLS